MWCPAASMGSRRASGGAGEQDTGLVMRWISVAPAGPFDVLDAGVRGLGASIGNPVGNEDFDGWPPGLDGGPQPPSLLHVGGLHVAAQDHLVLPGLIEVLHLEEPPELLLHPQAAESSSVGSSVANTASSRARALGERVSYPRNSSLRFAQAGSTLRPRRCSRSRTSRCRTRVTIRFPSCTRWKASTLILALGSCSVIAFLNAAEGSMATISIRFRQAWLREASQPPTAAESRPSTMPST